MRKEARKTIAMNCQLDIPSQVYMNDEFGFL